MIENSQSAKGSPLFDMHVRLTKSGMNKASYKPISNLGWKFNGLGLQQTLP